MFYLVKFQLIQILCTRLDTVPQDFTSPQNLQMGLGLEMRFPQMWSS